MTGIWTDVNVTLFFPHLLTPFSSSLLSQPFHPPADAAAGPGGAVGLPLSCCHGGSGSDAAARRPQPQQYHCHADRIHHPLLR